jgi:hypothetical protein
MSSVVQKYYNSFLFRRKKLHTTISIFKTKRLLCFSFFITHQFNIFIFDNNKFLFISLLSNSFYFNFFANCKLCKVYFDVFLNVLFLKLFKPNLYFFLFNKLLLLIFNSFLFLFFKKIKFRGKFFYIFKGKRNLLAFKFGYSHRFYIYYFSLNIVFLLKNLLLVFSINIFNLYRLIFKIISVRKKNIFTGRGI